MGERSRLEQQRHDRVADEDERGRGRHHEKRNLPQSAVEPQPQRFENAGVGLERRARHRGQLGGGDRQTEQADRQEVQNLRVIDRGDRAGRQQAREQVINVAADLPDAAPHHRPAAGCGKPSPGDTRTRSKWSRMRPSSGIVCGSCTTICSAAPATDANARSIASRSCPAARPVPDQRPDHHEVPRDRRGVRGEEPMMAVEHAEAPRRHHQQARARKENPHEANRQVALVAMKSRARSR